MSESSVDTIRLHAWLRRIEAGDLAARDELLGGVCRRLEGLARKMLRRFPRVGRWAQTDDVLQNSLLRLLRALQDIRPDSMRSFYGLAAAQMRRELLDLVRHFYGPQGVGANHDSQADTPNRGALNPVENTDGDADLEQWSAFHEAVELLPAEEREVVGLVFYHGWTQGQVAELFGVDERTIRRRWRSANLKLFEALKGFTSDLTD